MQPDLGLMTCIRTVAFASAEEMWSSLRQALMMSTLTLYRPSLSFTESDH